MKRPLLEGSGWEMEAWMARWDVLQREGEVIQMDREIEYLKQVTLDSNSSTKV